MGYRDTLPQTRYLPLMARVVQLCTSRTFLHYIDRLLAHLARAGHDVHLALAHNGAGPTHLPGVTVHSIPFSRKVGPLADSHALADCVQLLRRLQPDLVHAHNPKAGLVGMVAATLCRVPRRIYHVHGLPYHSRHGIQRRLLLHTERISTSLAHRVLCVGPSVREAVLTDCGVPSEKAQILSHGSSQGIDVDSFRKDQVITEALALRNQLSLAADDPLVLYCGRYHPEKGLDLLERAWPRVRECHPRAQLLLVGAPDEATPYDVSPLVRTPGVSLLPFMLDPRPAFAAAQLHVLPSLREGLPTSVLEAAAMEVPSLVSETLGCIDAVVPGQTGQLVHARDPEAWSHAMVELLGDEPRRQAMGINARAWVSHRFAPQAILDDLDACYRGLGVA